ncbi:MAG: phospholipid carrier-dependent glycosyltransferase [Casimicrobiaceae bacterium]
MSSIAPSSPGARLLWTLYGIATLSFATTLTLPYIGEEGLYTITAMEMKARGEYFINTLYGSNHGQPPLLNWLVIALADALGWEHVLVASRLVAAVATIATGLVLAWLVAALTQNERFAAFAALVYLTSDALLYHGWLAYTDPLFAFFTFGAVACLWVAATRRSLPLAWTAAAAVSCAALTKGQTAYVFYAIAALVLLRRCELRGFLLRPGVIVPQFAAAALYFVWHQQLTGGVQHSTDLRIVLDKLSAFDPGAYLHQLWWFPLETAFRFVPASVLVAYFWLRKQAFDAEARAHDPAIVICAWIAVINYLPYWLWPSTASRYVMPLYPLAAYLIAHALWRESAARMRWVVNCLIATIAFKYVAALWVYPAYQREYRGDYSTVAAEIDALARGMPFYATDVSAAGLSIAAYLDARRFPQQPLQWPPREWPSGFVLSPTEIPELGSVLRKFRLGRNDVYLLCRGVACDETSRVAAPSP